MRSRLRKLHKKAVQITRRTFAPLATAQWAAYRRIFPSSQPWEPTFFIIGPPRGGTTWLKNHLALHPNILMASGEPEYFSNYFHMGPIWYARRLRQTMFPEAKQPESILHIGEKSARYCAISIERIRLMNELFPHARYFLMSRELSARVWSAAKKQILKRGGEITEKRVLKFAKTFRCRFDEGHVGRRWAEVVGDRLLILRLEDIAADPFTEYLRAMSHLGLQETLPDHIAQSIVKFAAAHRTSDVPNYLIEYLQLRLVEDSNVGRESSPMRSD
jgi:Sulfotransferase domain